MGHITKAITRAASLRKLELILPKFRSDRDAAFALIDTVFNPVACPQRMLSDGRNTEEEQA